MVTGVRHFASREKLRPEVLFSSVWLLFCANESTITPSQVLGSVVGKVKIGKAERKVPREHGNGKSIRTRGYRDLFRGRGTRDRI
jgi:hypothetical protein